jgi:4-coumarate--CoA ligase
MTELSPATHMTPAGDFQPGSVGITLPNIECRIVSNGIDMPVGEEGELWMRGPMVMQGYLDDPQATSAMVDGDGWLRTGDIGRFDRSGHLYIVDRLKELIKVNAFQVAPAELEAVLLSHPSISDAAVVGVPDDVSGETPVAFVVLEPDHPELSEEDVVSYVASRVATYKKIRTVKFLDVIPKSASGKILRRLLTQANEATASDQ